MTKTNELVPLTGKQKSYLRGLGHSLKPLLQLGKAGITDLFIENLNEVLERHELIKVKLIGNSPLSLKEAAAEFAAKAPCHVAQTIGKTALLYRPSKENPEIKIPSA